MKTCKICNKQIGLNSKSLLCQYHYLKKWTTENRERSNEIKRAYVRRNPDKRKQSIDKYRDLNRKRVNAWAVLEYHVNNGDIDKPLECSICKLIKPLHAHHPDINKPLYVKWVCASCHKSEHGYQINYA